jgi:hypothetical protein
MSILDSILSSGSGGVVNQLAGQFGITAGQARSAASALLPALASGMQEKLKSGDTGLASLLGGGTLTQFADNPSALATPAALEQGKSLLARTFGSGDMSNIVSTVAEKAGIGSGVVSSMLPIAATFLGGVLSKSAASGGNLTDTLGQLSGTASEGLLGAVKSLASKVLGQG